MAALNGLAVVVRNEKPADLHLAVPAGLVRVRDRAVRDSVDFSGKPLAVGPLVDGAVLQLFLLSREDLDQGAEDRLVTRRGHVRLVDHVLVGVRVPRELSLEARVAGNLASLGGVSVRGAENAVR